MPSPTHDVDEHHLLREGVPPSVVRARRMSKAAERGDLLTVRRLLEDGISPDHAPTGNKPAMAWAVSNGNRTLFDLLLEHEADPFGYPD